MYRFLRQRFGSGVAHVLTAAWYAVLVILVLYCAFEPQTEFMYLFL
jgi:hypothetical protein